VRPATSNLNQRARRRLVLHEHVNLAIADPAPSSSRP
jgi:hypothetical protein